MHGLYNIVTVHLLVIYIINKNIKQIWVTYDVKIKDKSHRRMFGDYDEYIVSILALYFFMITERFIFKVGVSSSIASEKSFSSNTHRCTFWAFETALTLARSIPPWIASIKVFEFDAYMSSTWDKVVIPGYPLSFSHFIAVGSRSSKIIMC